MENREFWKVLKNDLENDLKLMKKRVRRRKRMDNIFSAISIITGTSFIVIELLLAYSTGSISSLIVIITAMILIIAGMVNLRKSSLDKAADEMITKQKQFIKELEEDLEEDRYD